MNGEFRCCPRNSRPPGWAFAGSLASVRRTPDEAVRRTPRRNPGEPVRRTPETNPPRTLRGGFGSPPSSGGSSSPSSSASCSPSSLTRRATPTHHPWPGGLRGLRAWEATNGPRETANSRSRSHADHPGARPATGSRLRRPPAAGRPRRRRPARRPARAGAELSIRPRPGGAAHLSGAAHSARYRLYPPPDHLLSDLSDTIDSTPESDPRATAWRCALALVTGRSRPLHARIPGRREGRFRGRCDVIRPTLGRH